MTSVEVVLLFIRDEWRYQLLLCELFPWKVLQPWMFLDLITATPTQPETNPLEYLVSLLSSVWRVFGRESTSDYGLHKVVCPSSARR